MKRIMDMKIKWLFGLLAMAMVGCTDLTELNENPNNVSETHPQLLLTQISHVAFSVQGTGPMYASRMLVQTDGENNYQYYNWNQGSFGDYNQLRDVTKMMEEAVRIDSDAYRALAKFFRAHYFYQLTLTFGDIPYSEALQGEESSIYQPKYDSQEDVFVGILQELEEANTLLGGSNEVIAGDIIYGGNASQWQRLVNAYRLRVLMSLSKKTNETGLDVINTFASIVSSAPLMRDNLDNGQLVFLDQDGSRYSQFNSSGYGSGMYMDSTFIKRLQDHKDPRLFIYCTQTRNALENGLAIDDFDAYEGGDPLAPYAEVNDKAAQGDVSKVNLRYSTDPTTEPHNLLSYAEQEFILAEAALRNWIAADPKAHYENGVKASFRFYNANASDYAQYVTDAQADAYLQESKNAFDQASGVDGKLELVLTQKYFIGFHQSGWRMYFDQLRTGYPTFAHTADAPPPMRWIYPQEEYIQNTEHVAAAISAQYGDGNDKIGEVPWWLK